MDEELAAPHLVGEHDFGLNSPSHNSEMLKKLKEKPAEVFATVLLGDGTKLYLLQTGDKTDGTIWAEYKDRLSLYIKFHTYHYSFLPVKSLTQTRLWRSKNLPVTNNFSINLFFKHILNFTGAVLSDKEHTPDGMEFWKRRCRESLARNLNVALVDFGSRSYTQFKSKIKLEEALELSWTQTMKSETRAKQVRWLIWK